MAYEDALKDYAKSSFTHGKWTRDVYKRGSGPAVIVIHEMPGLHPGVIKFADLVSASLMNVYCPVLFGVAGRRSDHPGSVLTMLGGICVRREFSVWADGKSSPIVEWLKALARQAHQDCGGKGVGAVGMCFTGGFALAMVTEPAMVAPVLSQPSLPMAMGNPKRSAGLDAAPAEIACARQRHAEDGLKVIGLRFKGDPFVPDARFESYKRELGDAFEAIELEDADAAPGPMAHPHSVLTLNLAETGPTKDAEERVIAYFRERTGAA